MPDTKTITDSYYLSMKPLLEQCDEARYIPGTALDAFIDLDDAVAADPQAATRLITVLPGMTHCRKCIMRYQAYLRAALERLKNTRQDSPVT